VTAQQLSPRLLDALLLRFGFGVHYTDEPKTEDDPDNLFDPVQGLDTVEGSFGDRAHPTSLYNRLELHPAVKRGGDAGRGAGAARLGRGVGQLAATRRCAPSALDRTHAQGTAARVGPCGVRGGVGAGELGSRWTCEGRLDKGYPKGAEYRRGKNGGSKGLRTRTMPNFLERRQREVRRIPLPRTRVNKGKTEGPELMCRAPTLAMDAWSYMSLRLL
jgi:hypothetical protein